jgi:hypothetical protein
MQLTISPASLERSETAASTPMRIGDLQIAENLQFKAGV